MFCSTAHASGMFAKASWWEMLLFIIFMYAYFMVHSPLFWVGVIFIAIIYFVKKSPTIQKLIQAKREKKNAPPTYNWVCPKCEAVNQAHTGECTNCHESVL